MKRIMGGVTILGLLLLAIPAGGVSDGGIDAPWIVEMNQETYWENLWGADCTKYENHSGYIPASYEAAVVKDGNMVRIYNPAPDDVTLLGAVNPANGQHFSAPHSWVMKCNIKTPEETTSTVTEESTTTLDDSTTSTFSETTSTTAAQTTTTIGDTTTTTDNGSILALWTASATCSSITAEWGEGISQVDVWSLDTVPGTDEQVGDLDNPFLEPGSLTVKVGTPTMFRLIAVPDDGWAAEPEFIDVTVGVCEETTTTIAGSSIPELPFTGAQAEALAVCALALIGVGGLVVYTVKGREEI